MGGHGVSNTIAEIFVKSAVSGPKLSAQKSYQVERSGTVVRFRATKRGLERAEIENRSVI